MLFQWKQYKNNFGLEINVFFFRWIYGKCDGKSKIWIEEQFNVGCLLSIVIINLIFYEHLYVRVAAVNSHRHYFHAESSNKTVLAAHSKFDGNSGKCYEKFYEAIIFMCRSYIWTNSPKQLNGSKSIIKLVLLLLWFGHIVFNSQHQMRLLQETETKSIVSANAFSIAPSFTSRRILSVSEKK